MILHELFSIEFLRVLWWLLLGVMLIAFALTDGFDMGVGALLPFLGRDDTERRIIINTVGPVWEGNQVWFILGGGSIFAAWPLLYAVSFSGFYLAMFIILTALIVRPVAFKYRSKRPGKAWRTAWDWALCYGGAVPALMFGVAVGNILLGVPFRLTPELLSIYDGNALQKLTGLLRPFALLAGVVSFSMLMMHGSAWLVLKTEDPIASRARRTGTIAALVAGAGYALGGLWLAFGIEGFHFVTPPDPNGPSNPLLTDVAQGGSWLAAYAQRPWIIIAPVLGFLGIAMVLRAFRSGGDRSPLIWSKLAIFGMTASVGLTMFPIILPSNTDPRSSLTVWDASSSQLTLFVMMVACAIFLPLIMFYTAWVYKVLWGKVTAKDINDHDSHAY